VAISSPTEGGWTAPLRKRQGWHMFVMKVFHHDDPTKGRLSLWYKPPRRDEVLEGDQQPRDEYLE
jgi:hypothetical protein